MFPLSRCLNVNEMISLLNANDMNCACQQKYFSFGMSNIFAQLYNAPYQSQVGYYHSHSADLGMSPSLMVVQSEQFIIWLHFFACQNLVGNNSIVGDCVSSCSLWISNISIIMVVEFRCQWFIWCYLPNMKFSIEWCAYYWESDRGQSILLPTLVIKRMKPSLWGDYSLIRTESSRSRSFDA